MKTQTPNTTDKATARLYCETDGNEVYICESGSNDRLCTMSNYSKVTNQHKADTIVQAVNEHEALLAVAEAAQDFANGKQGSGADITQALAHLTTIQKGQA